MIAFVRRPRESRRPTEADYAWATRRLLAAIRVIRRRWPPRSGRKLAALVRILADQQEARDK
jgi:hypothetical protein